MAKILMMEDEADQAELLAELLGSIGHSITVTYDANQAYNALKQERFDLLITDLYVYSGGEIASSGGISLIGKVRARNKSGELNWMNDMPILAVSGAHTMPGQEFILNVAKSVGADASLDKPIEPDDLFKTINALLAANG